REGAVPMFDFLQEFRKLPPDRGRALRRSWLLHGALEVEVERLHSALLSGVNRLPGHLKLRT
ncbi:MAG: hypothetical protein ABGY42_14965, partial [bacterium]